MIEGAGPNFTGAPARFLGFFFSRKHGCQDSPNGMFVTIVFPLNENSSRPSYFGFSTVESLSEPQSGVGTYWGGRMCAVIARAGFS